MIEKTLDYYEALPYRIELVADREADNWTVRYPELPGCVAAGETPEEALARGIAFKREWLSTALEAGLDIPEPQPEVEASGKLVLRLPKSLHQRATECARTEGVSLNTFLVQAVSECVGRSGTKQVYRMLEALLAKGLGHILPAKGIEAILVKIGVAIEPVYGQKQHPVNIEALQQKESAPPQIPASADA